MIAHLADDRAGHPAGTPAAGSPAPRVSAVRERLLQTASRLFYAEGIHAVGVDRIITEADVTRSTFYRHFPGKEDLVVAYVRSVDQAVRGLVQPLVQSQVQSQVPAQVRAQADSDANAPALLRAIARGLGDQICSPGFRGCAFINAAAEYPDRDSPVHRAVLDHREWFSRTVTEAMRRSGHPTPELAARHLVMLRDGANVSGYLGEPEAARETLVLGLDALLAECPPDAGSGATVTPGH